FSLISECAAVDRRAVRTNRTGGYMTAHEIQWKKFAVFLFARFSIIISLSAMKMRQENKGYGF
ncbi:MAG: hypothetical protein IKT01_06685, partial [Eubacteriaceae bacterium]|nr:hypothetical protein [Eubacteriaceae bacterium]